MSKEAEALLKEAIFEIKNLRRRNELMSARLDMFDAMNAILHTQIAARNEGRSPDFVYKIEKYLELKKSQEIESEQQSI